MARLLWAVICRRVIVDEYTNDVSYIDATWGMTAAQLPAPLPDLALGTQWLRQRESENLKPRVRMVTSEGTEVFVWEPPEEIAMEKRGHRINLRLAGIQIEKPGLYQIDIDQKKGDSWQTQMSLPFEVSVRTPLGRDDSVEGPRSADAGAK